GSNGNYATGWCHASNSIAVVESFALGKNSFSIPATNEEFGDPCSGTGKWLYISVSYQTPSLDFTCEDLGENEVTFTVTDKSGNEASTTAIVTVMDSLEPVVAPQDITVQLDETGAVSILPSQIDNGSTDYCGIASMSLDLDTFTCSNVGENEVDLSVVDNSGNTATATAIVTVVDNRNPVAATQNISVQLDANGQANFTADMIDNGSSDICGIASLQLDITSLDGTQLGPNTVTLTVTDTNGNQSTATATVTVVDEIAPE